MEMKGQMDVKKAVQTAKEYIKKIFDDENIQWVSLEEIVFEDTRHTWKVTIGFSRAWGVMGAVSSLTGGPSGGRTFKVVQIDDRTGHVVSVTHRTLTASD